MAGSEEAWEACRLSRRLRARRAFLAYRSKFVTAAPNVSAHGLGRRTVRPGSAQQVQLIDDIGGAGFDLERSRCAKGQARVA